tara:strand:+ start:10698 stop:11291 length:594 start_codon:yes stop_codon:yes gene_type:complete
VEQILLGIVVFNAFLMPSKFQFDTLEVSQVQLKKSRNSELNFGNELKTVQAIGVGSREYSQATSWLRYGHATYLYGHKSETNDGHRKLNHYGGYAGLLAEIHYKQYFGVGAILGGGASYTEFTDSDSEENDRSNYFLIGSPYVTLGIPLTKTTSINLTASSYIMSEPREQIDGGKEGFEAPHNLENKLGFEFVWSWD